MSARQYGKLPIANWRDAEWTSLTADAQWLYEFLVSQPTTDGAGAFPVQLRKWSRGAADMTVERVAAAAKLLAERRRIVVDHDTEEGLLRTFIRDDQAGQNIFKGQLKCALQVQSPMLRAVLLAEILSLDRSYEGKEMELVNELEKGIPAGSVSPTTPPPSTATTTQAFEPSSISVSTPFKRRSNGVADGDGDRFGGGSTCPICPEQRPAGPNGMCRQCSIGMGHPVSDPTW